VIVTRKHLPRRSFLRGLGAVVALPALDAMRPAFAATVERPLRLGFVYVPNGVTLGDWTPAGNGAGFELSRILKPLEPLREDLLVLTGLGQHNGNALGDGPGDHARAAASFLTGVHPYKTAGADIRNGVSADQLAADVLGRETLFPSLELGCETNETVGNCDSGYSCAYTNSLAWRSETTPLPPETNPRLVFERLFGSYAELDPETRRRRIRQRASVLDAVRERTAELVPSLGASDRRKLDEYLTALREIEQRIERAEKERPVENPGVRPPAGVPASFEDHAELMAELMCAAFRTDLTRVVTLMLGREGSVRSYPEIGVPEPHHPLTHHRSNPEWIDKVSQINTWHVELFGRLLQRLAAVREDGERLLDRSLILYGSGLGDGNRHTHEDLPILLAGRGGGVRPGRHLVYAPHTPLNNLFLTLLGRIGVPAESLGDSTGTLEHLTGV
jgi:hypothetical protein